MDQLDFNKKHDTHYAVPLWLRDEQVRVNTANVKGRIGEPQPKRDDPIAVVCYGPSLNDTWEKIREFKYIISGSGAHKFLLDRGIVPTWDVNVDPRAHKVELMGPPHKDVEYLVASTCHPKLFKHLEGFNVKLWHIFDSQEDGLRVLPRGEWALTGGQNVGLRQMAIARFFGFVNMDVFGMDGNLGPTGKHAAAHPAQAKGVSEVVYDGVTYQTTCAFLECAKQTINELDAMSDVTARFHGEGLVQHMMRNYKRAPAPENYSIIAFNKPELISDAYIKLNAQLHEENLAYGVGGGKHAERVMAMAEAIQKSSGKFPSILDYGAGKQYLAKALPIPIWSYDPAIPEISAPPRTADFCVSTDVLEHVEPDKLDFVLGDLRRCTRLVGFFAVHTGPASKKLPDGRNAHLIQEGKDWWSKRIGKYFHIEKIVIAGPELYFIVHPKEGKVAASVVKIGPN